MLLFPVWQAEHVLVASLVTTVALGLVAFGLARTRLREVFVNTYISQQALLGSITFIVIGLYLLAIGAVGEWLRRTDQPLGVGLSVVVVFGALVGLAIAAFSKTVRAEIRRFIARNFYRSKYDYRAKWLRGHRGISAGDKQRRDHGSPARPLNQDFPNQDASRSGRFGRQIGGFPASVR